MSTASSSELPSLNGLRVVDLGGVRPGLFAAVMLAELGADVVRVDHVGSDLRDFANPRTHAPRQAVVALDLKSETGATAAREFACRADGLIEGFRPGVHRRPLRSFGSPIPGEHTNEVLREVTGDQEPGVVTALQSA